MNQNWSKFMIALIVAGIVMAGIGFVSGASNSMYIDRTGLHVASAEAKKLLVTDPLSFDQLELQVSTADVRVIPGDAFRLEAEYTDGVEPGYTLDGNVLRIYDSAAQDRSFRLNVMSFGFNRNYVYVTLPRDLKLERAKISSDVGSVTLQSLETARLETRCSTGRIDATDIRCDEWISTTGVGDMRLENVEALKKLEATSGTGSITIRKLRSAEAVCRSDVGDMDISGLETDALSARSDTGRVKVQGALSGINQFSTGVGEIDIETSFPKNTYLIDANSSVGSVSIAPSDIVADTGNIAHQIIAKSGTGSVKLRFAQ